MGHSLIVAILYVLVIWDSCIYGSCRTTEERTKVLVKPFSFTSSY